jgi:hypothetical protein
MALQEKIRERSQPFLEPGETMQTAFLAQTGPTPWLAGAFGALIYMFIAKYRIVVVTDRAVVLLKAGAFRPAKPKEVVKRLPRTTPIGPFEGKIWGKVQIDGERHWVHRRFKDEIQSAAVPPAA